MKKDEIVQTWEGAVGAGSVENEDLENEDLRNEDPGTSEIHIKNEICDFMEKSQPG